MLSRKYKLLEEKFKLYKEVVSTRKDVEMLIDERLNVANLKYKSYRLRVLICVLIPLLIFVFCLPKAGETQWWKDYQRSKIQLIERESVRVKNVNTIYLPNTK